MAWTRGGISTVVSNRPTRQSPARREGSFCPSLADALTSPETRCGKYHPWLFTFPGGVSTPSEHLPATTAMPAMAPVPHRKGYLEGCELCSIQFDRSAIRASQSFFVPPPDYQRREISHQGLTYSNRRCRRKSPQSGRHPHLQLDCRVIPELNRVPRVLKLKPPSRLDFAIRHIASQGETGEFAKAGGVLQRIAHAV